MTNTNEPCKPGRPHSRLLSMAVLAAAQREPVSGSAFCALLGRWTQGKWKVSPGTIYPMLQGMERGGLVTCSIADPKGRGRRELVYTTTAKGAKALHAARAQTREAMRSMIARTLPVATFINVGEEDPELMEMVPRLAMDIHQKMWGAAALPKERRRKAMERLQRAIESVRI